jgi:hypothetical protein
MGVDPGVNGAIGFVDSAGTFVQVYDMPVLTTTTGRKQLDFAQLAAIIAKHAPTFSLVERVGSRPGEGAVGAFSFGVSFGGILGVMGTLAAPHDLVQPAVWKRRAGIPAGSEKSASIQLAIRLLPAAAPMLTRKKDDGRAEALLIALQAWERRQPAS